METDKEDGTWLCGKRDSEMWPSDRFSGTSDRASVGSLYGPIMSRAGGGYELRRAVGVVLHIKRILKKILTPT